MIIIQKWLTFYSATMYITES